MSGKKSGSLGWVLWPAFLTLAITLVRLWGELSGWPAEWFGTAAGGGATEMSPDKPDPVPSLFGIFWLIPITGIYLAGRLRLHGVTPDHRGKALLFSLIGFAFLAVPAGILMASSGDQPSNSTETTLGYQAMAAILAAGGWIGVIFAFVGWRALAGLAFFYALLARLPVMILTVILVPMDLGTHYEKLPPRVPDMSEGAKVFWLCAPQVGFWIPLTILVGAVCGALTSFLVPLKRGY